MTYLILGLLLFIGTHSIRIAADKWRSSQVARLGENRWKAIYSALSIVGFMLIIWGYGLARGEPLVLWAPPVWTRHLAALLTLPAFILLVAVYIPANRIKARVGHPMVASVILWALAHLTANGNLADVLLFGCFLIWAIANFRVARLRDRVAGVARANGSILQDGLTLLIGVVAWAGFAVFLHLPLIGVKPF